MTTLGASVALQGAGAFMMYQGNRSAAKAAQRTADYNAALAENEAVILARSKAEEEAVMRRRGQVLQGRQIVAMGASGVLPTGSNALTMAESYYDIAMAASHIQYASSLEQLQKQTQADTERLQGKARAFALESQGASNFINSAGRLGIQYTDMRQAGKKDFVIV